MSGRRLGPRKHNDYSALATLGLGVLAVALIGSMLGAWLWFRYHVNDIDETTLCPLAGPVAVSIVLIDRSDPITPLQQARVQQALDQVVADAPIGGLVAFYVAESDGIATLAPAVALCNPGREANQLYQNVKKIRQRFEEGFANRIASVRQKLLSPSQKQTSPIMESIKAVCIDAFGRFDRSLPKQLMIVSDFIQHSPIESHYKSKDYEKFLKSPSLNLVIADCKGADVDLLYLLRPPPKGGRAIQDGSHQRFWDLMLQVDNAKPRRLEAV